MLLAPKSKIKLGDVFGRLTVVGQPFNVRVYKDRNVVQCVCLCACGKRVVRIGCNLLSGNTQSCGCKADDEKRGRATHGASRSRLYEIWSGMKARCNRSTKDNYRHYGGRGITVCREWEDSFEAFQRWALANGYTPDVEIDRKNNSGDYSPINCHWVTHAANCRNKRDVRQLTAFGETKGMIDWAEDPRCIVSYENLRARVWRGMPPEQAMTKPLRVW